MTTHKQTAVRKQVAEKASEEAAEERAQRRRDKRLGQLENPAHDTHIPAERRE